MSNQAKKKMLQGYLHRQLAEHRQEMALRMTTLLQEYHSEYIEALEHRVMWLELPWHRRLWMRAKAWWEGRGGDEDVPDSDEEAPGGDDTEGET